MYFKVTIKTKNYSSEDPTFVITQKVMSGLLYVMQKTYEEQFKHFKIITNEGTDKYSVIFKITKGYYEALNDSLDINQKEKKSIIKAIQNQGYVCEYSK